MKARLTAAGVDAPSVTAALGAVGAELAELRAQLEGRLRDLNDAFEAHAAALGRLPDDDA